MDGKGGILCEVCGNEIRARQVRCPYCGVKRNPMQNMAAAPVCRTVNLEKGMPPVRDALRRMSSEIASARLHGERVLIFIHGYGSSGTGGLIKEEVRRQLHYLVENQEIHDLVPGEDCHKRSKHFRQLVKRFPALGKVVKNSNPGIIVAVI